LAVRVMLEV